MIENSTEDTKNKLVALVALLVFFGVILCMGILMYDISQYEEISRKLDSINSKLILLKESNKLCQHN